jgi:predicted extracellular nuclease/phosphodiesterase/alkaline phosphatase D-like protein
MPVSFTGSYTQTFDSLALTESNLSWANDQTLAGWSLFRQPLPGTALSTYAASTGSSATGSFVSYGSTGSTDRALGGLGSGGAYFGSPASGSIAGWMALALTNRTADTIRRLTVTFNGEQWRNGGNATAQTMVFQQGYGDRFDQVPTWFTPGGTFNWSSPVATASAAPVNGNTVGRVAGRGGELDLSTIPWAPGTTLWLRWVETNDAGNDHGLAIDDLTIQAVLAPLIPEVSITTIDAQASEFGDEGLLRISRTGLSASDLVVAMNLVSGSELATQEDLTAPWTDFLTIPAGSTHIDLPIRPLDDSLDEGPETLTVTLGPSGSYTLSPTAASASLTIADNDRVTLISQVQGSGSTTTLAGQSVILRGIVVGDFQSVSELGGFVLQEETADWDSSSLTSEGIFVTYGLGGGNTDVTLGDRVSLSGVAGERFGQTVLLSVNALKVEARDRLADTRAVVIPDLLAQRASVLDLEPYEGMWVRFPETLSVNGLYGQFRFGEVELSAGGLPNQPTNVMRPGPEAYAAEQAMALRELVLDDGSQASHRPASAATTAAPVRDQLLRRGDTISGLEGVLSFDFSKYRLHPTAPLSFNTLNPRPPAPATPSPGQLRVASFNVLNTFTTLNAGGALTDTGLAPRGANTSAELERQLTGLATALAGLQADVIGLMEVENDADDATLATIAQRLNAALPADAGRVYSHVSTGLIGTDAIKVGLLYNSNAVALLGGASVLDAVSFTDPLGSGVPKNRPALAQAFRERATGEVVNVVVNHFKSKGSNDATGPDRDQQDGQSAFNATRTAAATELARWITTRPTANTDADWVILGDLNAYAKEEPLQVLEAAGYRNALSAFTADPPTSYAFYNPVEMSGALDHILLSPSLVRQATSAAEWGINAAEGAFRDYNLDTNSNGNPSVRDFFTASGFRTSDHDPLLVDFDLGRSQPSGLTFAHGVASGDPYHDSVILWTRVTPPPDFSGLIDVRWEVSTSASFTPASIVGQGVFTTSAGRGWTVKVEAAGLAPDSVYFYRFSSGDQVSASGETKTLPVGGDPVRLAVFSCANFPAAEQFAAYGRAVAIQANKPYDAIVHLGDYIYEYGPGGYGTAEDADTKRGFQPKREIIDLLDYRQRYAQYHTDVDLQALRAAAPLIAIWDDHETANDSWMGGAENHQSATEGDWLARRDAALKAYHEWMPIREPGMRQVGDGASALSPLTRGYRSFNFGDVLDLHVLETRLTARDQQLRYPTGSIVQALEVVQQAWGDPNRDLIGDTQLAWLQERMASSSASWQVLGQQVLMQSMALPAELLLNPGEPTLLDKYAAPLQKLATGTPFAQLSSSEQALFQEVSKIPYNLDAWDGYGAEREAILQTALQLGTRLISLAGDTHNAWAGVLDTMSTGVAPAGTVAGVEFATPGVTSPGLEKYLPGADAYLRARYPAIDGLDGLFRGYIDGLKYADVNRRGFLDLTVTAQQAIGDFQLLSGIDPLTSQPRWISERVIANQALQLTVLPQPPTLSLSPLSADTMEGSIGAKPFTFTLRREGDPSVPVSVSWSVSASGPNAANALDFAGAALPAGVATLAAGETSQRITINVVGDGTHEADESFTLSLSKPVGGALLEGAITAGGRIQNDDLPSPPRYIFSKSAEAVDEGSSFAIGLSTTNVAPGTPLFWSFSGVGITAADFRDGLLEGATLIGSDGRAGFSKALAADASNDPDEILELRFYSDAARSQQVGSALTILLRQPSVGLVTDASDGITGGSIGESLIGVPAGSTLRGRGSLDRLTGGGGDDLFVLGDQTGPFYDDGTPGLGSADLALITDFNPGDRIQLHGLASDYRLVGGRHAGVAGVRIDALVAGLPETIGFVHGASLVSLNLTDSSRFVFV